MNSVCVKNVDFLTLMTACTGLGVFQTVTVPGHLLPREEKKCTKRMVTDKIQAWKREMCRRLETASSLRALLFYRQRDHSTPASDPALVLSSVHMYI